MWFQRKRPKKLTFDDFVQKLPSEGFETRALAGGRVEVVRDAVAAVIADGGEHPKVVQRAGIRIGEEIGTLMDGGFQKFFQTPGGVTKPAVAGELKAVHDFEEDLRSSLGLVSLYNQSLGSVSNVYLYDRVKGRDTAVPKKPWEKKVRAESPSAKL